MRKAWKALFAKGGHSDGRQDIRSLMGLCPQAELRGMEDVTEFAQWLQGAFDFLAMVSPPPPPISLPSKPLPPPLKVPSISSGA